MRSGEPSRESDESPFACPACRAGLGLPRHAAQVGTDRWPVGLRCHRCGHEWELDRGALARGGLAAASPDRWRPLPATPTVVQPIAACRHCAGLITLDLALDLGLEPRASRYTCPHCGGAGEVSLPGAVVRQAVAVPPRAAIAS